MITGRLPIKYVQRALLVCVGVVAPLTLGMLLSAMRYQMLPTELMCLNPKPYYHTAIKDVCVCALSLLLQKPYPPCSVPSPMEILHATCIVGYNLSPAAEERVESSEIVMELLGPHTVPETQMCSILLASAIFSMQIS